MKLNWLQIWVLRSSLGLLICLNFSCGFNSKGSSKVKAIEEVELPVSTPKNGKKVNELSQEEIKNYSKRYQKIYK